MQVRGIGGDLVEEVALIDSFTSPKNGARIGFAGIICSFSHNLTRDSETAFLNHNPKIIETLW